jgi:uncharacterized protein (DUF952 family)
MLLYRIEPRSSWNNAQSQGVFWGELEQDGFIHLSTLEQVLEVANALYPAQTDLLLLEIDPKPLEGKVVFEDLYGYQQDFPHLYGPLKTKWITRVLELHWTGLEFVLPLELK